MCHTRHEEANPITSSCHTVHHTVILSSAPIKHLLFSALQLSSILICNNPITSYSCVCVNSPVSAVVVWLIVIWPPSFVLAFMSPDLISNQCRGGHGGQVEAITVVVSSMTVSPSADTATRHHEPDCIVLLLIVIASSCRGGPYFHFFHFSFRSSSDLLLTTFLCFCPLSLQFPRPLLSSLRQHVTTDRVLQ